VVKELLSDAGRRSCLRAMNREGATPLHLAVQAGLMDVAQLLVNAGAKVDASDRVSVWVLLTGQEV
jgi:ankyrin repeat protein